MHCNVSSGTQWCRGRQRFSAMSSNFEIKEEAFIDCDTCSQFNLVIASYRLSWLVDSLVDQLVGGWLFGWLVDCQKDRRTSQIIFSIVNHFFVIMCVFPTGLFRVLFPKLKGRTTYILFFTSLSLVCIWYSQMIFFLAMLRSNCECVDFIYKNN